jgi:DNA-binding transcriptional regulator YhcF (GntR family)
MLHQLNIDASSSIPKYKQIVNSIINGIEERLIGVNHRLPSINEVSILHDVSRDTVEKAYRELKQKGLISSIPGKGYFTSTSQTASNKKVLLLYNSNQHFAKQITQTFSQLFERKANFDAISHEGNIELFESIIRERKEDYTDFIISTSFIGVNELRAKESINRFIPKDKLLLLNRKIDGLTGDYKMVCHNFEQLVYDFLSNLCNRLHKYDRLELLFPADSTLPRGLIRGFQKYCIEQQFNSKIIFKDFDKIDLQAKTLYVVIRDKDLQAMTPKVKANGFIPGQDIGILGFNESLVKAELLGGISTMKLDYTAMAGKSAAIILSEQIHQIDLNCQLIDRGTI